MRPIYWNKSFYFVYALQLDIDDDVDLEKRMNINTLALYDLPQWIDDKTINFKCADSRCRAKINFIIKDGGKWEMISEAFILHQCTFIGSLKGEYRFLMVEESSYHKAYFFDEPTLWSMNALKKVG